MGKKINCLLCQSSKLEVTEIIKSGDIIKLWEKQHNNVRQLFNGVDSLEKYLCANCKLEFFYPFVPGDDEFYSKLGQEDWYYLHEDKTEFSYSVKYIQDGDSVLDIGSGRGAFTKYIDKNITYTGLDLSSKAIKYAQEENINVLEQTIESYANTNKEIHDVVVAFQVLEHIVSPVNFLSRFKNNLKDTSYIYIEVPDVVAAHKGKNRQEFGLEHFHVFSMSSLDIMINKAGFKTIEINRIQDPSGKYTLFAFAKIK